MTKTLRPRVLGVRALNQAAGLLVLSRENFPDLDLTHRLLAPPPTIFAGATYSSSRPAAANARW